jgi:HEPN domain-containing protein
MAERSSDWIAQARRDLEAARWQMEGSFHEWACFGAQHAAEGAVKAVYAKLGGEAWGHSVGELLDGLRERADVPEGVVTLGRALDRFSIPARYPNGWDARGVPATTTRGRRRSGYRSREARSSAAGRSPSAPELVSSAGGEPYASPAAE